MRAARVLFVLTALALVAADLTGSGAVTANTQTTISLTSGTSIFDTAIRTAFAGSATGQVSVQVTTDAATTIGVALALDAGAMASSNIAGGSSNAGFTALLSAFASLGISLKITTSTPTRIQLTITTPSIAASATATTQVNLLAGFNDNSASASGLVYGAVAVNVNGGSRTFTIPINAAPQLFLVAVDTSATTSASSAASTGAKSSDANNAGSAAFSYSGKFIPVSYNSDYNLQVGQQYAYGNNIVVTPISSAAAGSDAGSLNINFVSAFNGSSSSTTTSNGPNTAAYFNGYYQISGSASANNVLQWSSDTSASTNTFIQNGKQVASATFATTYANTASWYKSSTSAGAQAPASSWTQVSSYRGVTASGKISVFANVQSYSQWTVGSGSGTTVKAAYLLVVVASAIALLF